MHHDMQGICPAGTQPCAAYQCRAGIYPAAAFSDHVPGTQWPWLPIPTLVPCRSVQPSSVAHGAWCQRHSYDVVTTLNASQASMTLQSSECFMSRLPLLSRQSSSLRLRTLGWVGSHSRTMLTTTCRSLHMRHATCPSRAPPDHGSMLRSRGHAGAHSGAQAEAA
jgi:hypothetical protein